MSLERLVLLEEHRKIPFQPTPPLVVVDHCLRLRPPPRKPPHFHEAARSGECPAHSEDEVPDRAVAMEAAYGATVREPHDEKVCHEAVWWQRGHVQSAWRKRVGKLLRVERVKHCGHQHICE